MTFTFKPGSRSDLNRVRLRIGDTDSFAAADLRLEDEDIRDLLLAEGGVLRAAAAAAEVLAARFARKAEGSQGPDRIVPSDRANHLRRTAAQLRAAASSAALPTSGSPGPRAGGRPAFRRGLLDHPDA